MIETRVTLILQTLKIHMNIFFTRKYKYSKYDSLEMVLDEIKDITSRKWHNGADNITGKLNEDNSFQLTHKWSFSFIRWIETSPAYINGTIETDDSKTVIKTSVRPNSIFVLSFYFLIVYFIYNLFQPNLFTDEAAIFKLIFIPFFELILYALMISYTSGLRKNFERAMHLWKTD